MREGIGAENALFTIDEFYTNFIFNNGWLNFDNHCCTNYLIFSLIVDTYFFWFSRRNRLLSSWLPLSDFILNWPIRGCAAAVLFGVLVTLKAPENAAARSSILSLVYYLKRRENKSFIVCLFCFVLFFFFLSTCRQNKNLLTKTTQTGVTATVLLQLSPHSPMQYSVSFCMKMHRERLALASVFDDEFQ